MDRGEGGGKEGKKKRLLYVCLCVYECAVAASASIGGPSAQPTACLAPVPPPQPLPPLPPQLSGYRVKHISPLLAHTESAHTHTHTHTHGCDLAWKYIYIYFLKYDVNRFLRRNSGGFDKPFLSLSLSLSSFKCFFFLPLILMQTADNGLSGVSVALRHGV